MSRATKKSLIQHAQSLGIPENRLTGTKASIQAEIDSYETAMVEASADTASALSPDFPVDVVSDLDLIEQELNFRPRDTAVGPFMRVLAIGAAIFS